MKKTLMILSLVAVLVLSLGVAGFAYAQADTPIFQGFGPGKRGPGGDGPLHDLVVEKMAEILDLSVEELEERLEAGERPHEIAEAQGMDLEEFKAAMQEAKADLLEEAVAQGLITQEQADQIAERQAQRLERLAEFLGLSAEELEERLDAGQTVPEIAEELGVELPPKGFGKHHGGRLAELLGIDVEELHERLEAGETIPEIAEELGIELPERPEGFGPGRRGGPGFGDSDSRGPGGFFGQNSG